MHMQKTRSRKKDEVFYMNCACVGAQFIGTVVFREQEVKFGRVGLGPCCMDFESQLGHLSLICPLIPAIISMVIMIYGMNKY